MGEEFYAAIGVPEWLSFDKHILQIESVKQKVSGFEVVISMLVRNQFLEAQPDNLHWECKRIGAGTASIGIVGGTCRITDWFRRRQFILNMILYSQNLLCDFLWQCFYCANVFPNTYSALSVIRIQW